MDDKCDEILNNILCEVSATFAALKANYKNCHVTIDDYVDRLGKLTNIVMSVKTGLALSNSSAGFGLRDISKEESK